MHLRAVLVLGTASLSAGPALALAHKDVSPRCSFRGAPCPQDTRCVPSNPACVDLASCTGVCERYDRFPSCGGFTVKPHNCDDDATCTDDPRFPSSCGMACDVPGVCIPNDTPRCGGAARSKCPEPLRCYRIPRNGCDTSKEGGAGCPGICM